MPKKTNSSQKLLPRKPRVQIEYDVEVGNAIQKVELPWITGVFADLSGRNADQLPEMPDRKFSEVTAENFDSFLKDQKPRVQFVVDDVISGAGAGGKIGVDVTFRSMEDFDPGRIARLVGSEVEEIKIKQEGAGKDKLYMIEQKGPMSEALGDSVDSLDKLKSKEHLAYRLGVVPDDIEVSLVDDLRDKTKWTLQITKKGPIAKLLDARGQLEDLSRRLDVNRKGAKAVEELLANPGLMQQIVEEKNAPQGPPAE